MVRIELQHTQRRETFSPEPTLQHAAVCAPFRKRDERSAFHVTSTLDRRMVGVSNYDQSLGKDRNMFQDARGRRLSSEGSVQSAVGYFGHEVIVRTRRQFQAYFRVASMKVRKYAVADLRSCFPAPRASARPSAS